MAAVESCLSTNYNLSRLFIDKNIIFYKKNKELFTIKLKTAKEVFLDMDWNKFYRIITTNVSELSKQTGLDVTSSFDFVKQVLFEYGKYTEFWEVNRILTYGLKQLHQKINWSNGEIKIGNIIIDEEIWEYIIYIVKLSYGEKVNRPMTFVSEEAKKLYLAQKEMEDEVNRIRNSAKANGEDEGIIKTFLMIVYAFPSLTFDYLWDQTLAQIHWLQQKAAGAVSYEVTSKVYAAGNLKSSQKLEFFIK